MVDGIIFPPIDKSQHYIDMMSRLVLIFVLLGILMVSYHYYRDEYKPATLSTIQYATFAREQQTSSNPVQTVNDFSYVSRLSSCPGGQCAINKVSGIKRCPAKDTSIITYDTLTEACTKKNTCDYPDLKFSVLPDGSTSESGVCQDDDPCSCTNKLKCSPNLMSSFEITYGSNYVPSNDNYTIQQNVSRLYTPGLTNLEIENPGTEFCLINPGFTNKLTVGCDLRNGVNDKLDCQNIQSIRLQNITDSPEEQPEFFLQTSINRGDVSMKINRLLGQIRVGGRCQYDSNLITPLFSEDITSGIVKITPGEGTETSTKWEIVYFNSVNKYASTSDEDDQNYLSVGGIVHLFSSDGTGTYGSPGFHLSFSKDNELPRGYLYGFGFFNCLNTIESANYKNMSLCLRPERQPCKEGFLTYKFDKLHTQNETSSRYLTDERFSRNFCQQRTNFEGINRSEYLEDPGYYTLGCTIGSGCSDTELVLSSDLKGVEAAKEKYFPDFDLNAVRGSWTLVLKKKNSLILNFDEPDRNILSPSVSGLLTQETIQPGDLWSVKTYSGEIVSSGIVDGTNNRFISFYNIGDLTDYLNYGRIDLPFFTSRLQDKGGNFYLIKEVKIVDSKLVIVVDQAPPTEVLDGDIFKIIPGEPDKILASGKVVQTRSTNTGKIIYELGGPGSSQFPYNSEKEYLTGVLVVELFKQYSFSGPNYNTVVSSTDNTYAVVPNVKPDKLLSQKSEPGFLRVLSNGEGLPYLDDGNFLFPPETLQSHFLSQGLSQSVDVPITIGTSQNFQDPNAEFKQNISMYYPVWNPVLFQQECVRCKPLLLAYPQITTQNDISQVFIQYCSKDFQSYQYNFSGKNYIFSNLSKLDTSPDLKFPNKTSEFYIEEPNFDVSVGDYIIDSSMQFEYIIETDSDDPLRQSNGSIKIKPQMEQGNYVIGLEESYNERYIVDGDKLEESGGVVVISGRELKLKNSVENYFFGKKYSDDKGVGYYFIPVDTVIDISTDGKRILTSSNVNRVLERKDTYIQFCKIKEPLIVTVDPPGVNPADYSSSKLFGSIVTGSRAVAQVSSIVDGRIVNLRVSQSGDAYSYNSPPSVNIQNYFYPS